MIESFSRSVDRGHREVLSQEYPSDDIDRWKSGGKRWREFEAQLTMLGLRNELTDSSHDALRSVFLGEKPAVFLESGDKLKKIHPIIEASGLTMTHGRKLMDLDYVYDPQQVSATISEHSEVFNEDSRLPTASEVMESLVKVPDGESAHKRGLVLGFPNAAVNAFQERRGIGELIGDRFYDVLSKADRATFDSMFADLRRDLTATQKGNWLRTKLREYGPQAGISAERLAEIDGQIDREASWQGYGAHGFVWTDFADSTESIAKSKRIKDAFLVAGLAR